MPDKALVAKMLVFLRDARNNWTRLAEEADNERAAQRARAQAEHCQHEIERLLADFPEIGP